MSCKKFSRSPGSAAGGARSREFVAVDWGSTRLRMRLIGEAPGDAAERAAPRARAIAERSSGEGIGKLRPADQEGIFRAVLLLLLEDAGRRRSWEERGGEVYLAGMVTSTLGWTPTPYVRVPAGPREIWAGRKTRRLENFTLHFLPGVRTRNDVMRGEEVEAVGILGGPEEEGEEPLERTLVLPGTHSKWILWKDGRIEDFVTVPTGDLHAGLHSATLLSRTLPEEPPEIPARGPLPAAFDRGADLARRDGPLASLFKARSLPVLDSLPAAEASALLSGILIGGEILERTRAGSSAEILVAGAAPLRRLYLRAFRRLGIPAKGVPEDLAEQASAAGISRLRRLGEPDSPDARPGRS